ncbi:MAG: hypothetical protein ACP5E5_01090 [Acidobacteriaceae bacterium]
MRGLIWAGNLLGWPVIQLSGAWISQRLPTRLFEQDSWMTAPRRWESEGRIYREWLRIRRWKGLLPDGGAWFGGFEKKRIGSWDSAHLVEFLLETRRAEVAHWCMMLCLPVFFLWNPPWACLVMAAYALAGNLPCIAAQRYNRIALERLLMRRREMRLQ